MKRALEIAIQAWLTKGKLKKRKLPKNLTCFQKSFSSILMKGKKVGTAFLLKKERKQADYNHSFIQNLFTINPNTSVAKV